MSGEGPIDAVFQALSDEGSRGPQVLWVLGQDGAKVGKMGDFGQK